MDSKEFKLPETTYIRDIENKVFQGIVLQCLAKIEGITLIEGNLFDSLLGRNAEIKGIYVEQDQKKRSLFVKVEINIKYGINIPEKAEEVQNTVVKELIKYTGLYVSNVHVIFKNVVTDKMTKEEVEKEEVLNTEENSNSR